MHTESPTPCERSDAKLVAAALRNDHRAFELLLRRHIEGLRRLLASLLFLPDLVDDVAQQAYLTAWQQLKTIETPASFRSWLYGIGLRFALQERRRTWKHRARNPVSLDLSLDLSLDVDRIDGVDTGHTPYSDLAQRTVRARLERAIRTLPKPNAEVVTMHYLQELSCPEIAERLGLPLATVHKRLSRGRDMLARVVAPMRSELAFAGALGAAGAPRHSTEKFVEATMRAVRRHPRPATRPDRAGAARAAVVAHLLARWRVVLGIAVTMVISLVSAIGFVLALAHGVHDVFDGPPNEPSPRRSMATNGRTQHPPAPQPLVAPTTSADERRKADLQAYLDAPDPDYVVRSESTEVGSAIFGAHGLCPMDAYGERLYELVSKAFVMHFALCLLKDVVGADDRSWIEVDLRFSLRRNPNQAVDVARQRAVADEGEVVYRVVGLELSKMQRSQFSRCIKEAFHNTGFPSPDDGAPRDILHHIAIDFGAIQETLKGISASAQ